MVTSNTKSIMKKTRVIILCVISIAIAIVLLNYHYKLLAINTSTTVDSEKRMFSVLTFNIAAFDTLRFTNSLQAGLLELINQEKPEIVSFQELSYVSLNKMKSQLDSIYGIEDNTFCSMPFYSCLPQRNMQRYKCVGNISVEDLTEAENKEIDQMQKQMHVSSSEFEIEPGHWITIFSGQLRSSAYSTARRSMDKDASWFDGISLYKRNYEVGKRIRDYEAENVRRFVDEARTDPSTGSETNMPVIVAGDQNDWCGSDCLDVLIGLKGSRSLKGLSGDKDQLKDAWWEGGNGFGWTYFGWHLRLRLDHILYSDELELVDVKVIDSDLSDHKPLVARFRIK